MKTLSEGEELDLHRVQLGPFPAAELRRQLEALGWTWHAPSRRAPKGALHLSYAHGWAELPGFPSQRLLRLAGHLSRETGRTTALRTQDAAVAVASTDAELHLTQSWTLFFPDGRRAQVDGGKGHGVTEAGDEAVTTEAVQAQAEVLWDEMPMPDALTLDADPLFDKAWAPVEAFVVPAATDPVVQSGPTWTVRTAAGTLEVGPDARAATDELLDISGRLDPAARAPDMARWAMRATRRAGLDADPSPGTPGYDDWHALMLQLSAADRASTGRRYAVPTWKLRQPGTWELVADECKAIASLPGVDAELAGFLDGADAATITVRG